MDGEKALLGWLISDTPKHRCFIIEELNGEAGAIDTFFISKDYIIKGKPTPFNKSKTAKSYDRYMEDFKRKGIKPNVI